MKIIVDAMGGDQAPAKIVDGAVMAAREFEERRSGDAVILTGPTDVVTFAVEQAQGKELLGKTLHLFHTDEVIAMDESPSEALKKKTKSSIHAGIDMVRRGEAAAFISMGNTGAVMAVATMGLGRIEGILRPVIGAFLPTITGQDTLLLDVGSNVDCKPQQLLQFGLMGSLYMHAMRGIPNPRVGLLSVGEEDAKGNEVTIKANELFRQNNLFNFCGNKEGRDLMMGTADVVVCDGFTGNVVLKLAESFVKVLKKMIGDYIQTAGPEAGKIIGEFVAKTMTAWDYQSHGGVPLLGVNGIVIIGHGSSSAKAVYKAVQVAKEMAEKQIVQAITEKIKLTELN